MLKLLVAFTTYDGHTAKIEDRIAPALRDNDSAVDMCDLARLVSERCTAESI